jgi:hypothetical protein
MTGYEPHGEFLIRPDVVKLVSSVNGPICMPDGIPLPVRYSETISCRLMNDCDRCNFWDKEIGSRFCRNCRKKKTRHLCAFCQLERKESDSVFCMKHRCLDSWQ